jgi:hypothetical protein
MGKGARHPVSTFFAAWHEHGRGAGPIRNRQMLEEGRPDLVVAFPGGHGTAGMIKLALKAGVPVEMINLVDNRKLNRSSRASGHPSAILKNLEL